jgi:transcriptional regulator with XRE-family HTH domain
MTASTLPIGQSRVDIIVGARLVTALDARTISKTDLARHLEQKLETIEQFCRGEVRIGPARLLAICELLNVSVGWFFAE